MKSIIIAATVLAASCTGASAQIANTPEIAAKIRELGPELSREMVGGTMALYKPLHEKTDTAGVTVTRNQSYGPHERNVLDVYAPEDADGSQPIMVFVHGGGFVRGDKAGIAPIGTYFARRGIVTIPINYRFAPDSTWPSGGQDVAMALKWIAENPDIHGGDPSKIVIAGNSAGAMHVADYAFREDLQNDNDGVVGAIIISPPVVDLTARPLDPDRDLLYYGAEGDRAEQSVVNALDGRKIPVLVAYAEYEPDVVIDQTRLLIEGLAKRDGRLPLIVSAPGHNHISIVEHIGTADETLGPDITEFVLLEAMRSN